MSGRSFRPCAFRHLCFTVEPMLWFQSSGDGIWRSKSPAKYIEYPGSDHAYWTGDVEALHGDIEEFITGHRESPSTDLERVLATVLFTDIVGSTRSAAEMGDQTWRRLL